MNKKRLFIYTDGACRGNPGDGGIGVVIKDDEGNIVKRVSRYIGKTTNNQAEYTALLFALKSVKDYNPEYLKIHSDSELLVKQMGGTYSVKNVIIHKLFSKAKEMTNKFLTVEFEHIPREKNKEADLLANNALDRRLKSH